MTKIANIYLLMYTCILLLLSAVNVTISIATTMTRLSQATACILKSIRPRAWFVMVPANASHLLAHAWG
jgi:hypothetical protein